MIDFTKMALKGMRQKIVLNKPNPACPDNCNNAKESLLYIANHTFKTIDPTKIIIICANCGNSIWMIQHKKEEKKE